MKLRQLAGLVCLSALATACTTLQKPPSGADWPSRAARLAALEQWQLRGRLAYKDTDGSGGQASLHWQQYAAVSRLRLAGPFGAGAVEMVVAPDRVSVSDAQGEQALVYTGADALESFMRAELGWSFPAASARYWVLGIADPRAPADRVAGPNGELMALSQYGWQIDYQRFAEFDGIVMPVKLSMVGPRGRLRVVVTDWSFASGGD